MGREVRRVPEDWKHPKKNGQYIALHGGSFSERVAKWDLEKQKWDEGFMSDFKGGWEPKGNRSYPFAEYDGPRPEKDDYMPDWPEAQRTHLQMYETCSEGTPISPVMDTPENLARWLADNRDSSFGSMTASYEGWLATIRAGSAFSMAFSQKTGMISGVELNKMVKERPI